MTPMRFLWNFEILWLLCLSENNYENYVMIFDYNLLPYSTIVLGAGHCARVKWSHFSEQDPITSFKGLATQW